jgi:hypothetical protein
MLLTLWYSTPFLTGTSLHFTALQPEIPFRVHPVLIPFTALYFTSLHFTSLHFTSSEA